MPGIPHSWNPQSIHPTAQLIFISKVRFILELLILWRMEAISHLLSILGNSFSSHVATSVNVKTANLSECYAPKSILWANKYEKSFPLSITIHISQLNDLKSHEETLTGLTIFHSNTPTLLKLIRVPTSTTFLFLSSQHHFTLKICWNRDSWKSVQNIPHDTFFLSFLPLKFKLSQSEWILTGLREGKQGWWREA